MNGGIMRGLVVRVLIIMLGLYVASALVPGVAIDGLGNFILADVVLGIVNSFVRPIAFILTLPLTIVTLGLFLLILNAAMFGLAAAFLNGFSVSGFWAALFGAVVVSITGTIASWMVGPSGRYEIYVVTRR